MHREAPFECTFASSAMKRSAVIAAWDARMAEALFRSLLMQDREDEQGVIEVRLRGRVQRQSRFSPSDGAPTAA